MIPYIETRDRVSLFYKDWGTGKPVVFIHGGPWARTCGSIRCPI